MRRRALSRHLTVHGLLPKPSRSSTLLLKIQLQLRRADYGDAARSAAPDHGQVVEDVRGRLAYRKAAAHRDAIRG